MKNRNLHEVQPRLPKSAKKRLAALIVLLCFVGTPFKVSSRSQASQQNGSDNNTEDARAKKKPTAVKTPPVRDAVAANKNQTESQQVKTQNEEHVTITSLPKIYTHNDKDIANTLLTYFTGALVLVGSFQILFLWRTVRATKDNAEAAKLNAEALINSERAWITGSIGEDSYKLFGNPTIIPSFELIMKNSGKTPGLASRVIMKFEKRDSLDNLPQEPQFDIHDVADFGAALIVKNEPSLSIVRKIDGRKPLTGDEQVAVRDDKLFLFVYGYIEYTNVTKPDSVNPHTSRFCFVYSFSNPIRHGFQVCYTASASYRTVT